MSQNRERRPFTVKVRLSIEERAELHRKANAAGMTLAELLRDHADQMAVVNRSDWRRRTFQLVRIGNNTNQIARWANAHKSAADAHQVVLALLRLERAIRAEYGLDHADAFAEKEPAPS